MNSRLPHSEELSWVEETEAVHVGCGALAVSR